MTAGLLTKSNEFLVRLLHADTRIQLTDNILKWMGGTDHLHTLDGKITRSGVTELSRFTTRILNI